MRLASRLAPPAAVAALVAAVLAIPAAPASAERNDPCANARAAFQSHMNEARFWIGAADRLAETGAEWQAAFDEANHFLDLAEGDLGDMSAAC